VFEAVNPSEPYPILGIFDLQSCGALQEGGPGETGVKKGSQRVIRLLQSRACGQENHGGPEALSSRPASSCGGGKKGAKISIMAFQNQNSSVLNS